MDLTLPVMSGVLPDNVMRGTSTDFY